MVMPVHLMGATVPPLISGEALSLALLPISKTRISVKSYGTYVQLEPTPDQEKLIADFFTRQINAPDGNLRFQTGGITLRVLLQNYWMWILALAALGYVAGKVGK